MALENLTWDHTIQAIATIYNRDAAYVEQTLTDWGVEVGDVEGAFRMLEDTSYEIWYNKDGTVRTYNYVGTADVQTNPLGGVDSNLQTVEKVSTKVPLDTKPSTTDPTKATFKAGVGSKINMVASAATTAIAAASVGVTLGHLIDSTLYNANPGFWDSQGWGTINPETWNSITMGDDSLGATYINMLYHLDPTTNTSQAYMDQYAFAYMTSVLHRKGFFANGDIQYPPTPTQGTIITVTSFVSLNTLINECIPNPIVASAMYEACIAHGWSDSGCYKLNFKSGTASGSYQRDLCKYPDIELGTMFTYNSSTHTTCECLYYGYNMSSTDPNTAVRIYGFTSHDEYLKEFIGLSGSNGIGPNGATTMGTINGVEESAIDGITDDPNATTFDNSGITDESDIDAILALIASQYPDLFANAITQNVIQPDGTVKTYTYLPVATPNISTNPTTGYTPDQQPVSTSSTQTDPEVDPETAPASQIEYLTDVVTEPVNPNDETTGGGNTPPVVIPVGSASALYSIYNPTNSEVSSFGGWLWSSNFVDQLLKMFNDPMQAIISLHKVFCTPSVSGRDDIKVGYLNSGVESNTVDEQYVTVSCGSVNLYESFNNVFDYPPHTDVSLYLPFIGIVKLDTNDVMRSTISVTYHIDVLTGACLAEVSVMRDMFGGVLYQYAGDCSVHYPLSSGSYMGIVSALLGVAGTVASGGALAPIAIGAAGAAMGARSSIERSGGFSGNAGAMGSKIPYLIIQRPQTNMAADFETFEGKPSNETVKISECTGFISCTEVHALNTICTESEMNELISLLKNGILI